MLSPILEVDYAILGAGVVGLALAEALTRRHPSASVLLIERHRRPGQETSSRSSEVIHAGLYYWDVPYKGETCRRGRELLYAYCAQLGVDHLRCGKYIVATDDTQLAELARIARYAAEVGVPLHELPPSTLRDRLHHPGLIAGLWSPSTGIVDSHGLLRRLEAAAVERGALFSYGTRFLAPERTDEAGCRFTVRDAQGQLCQVQARRLFNAAGLKAAAIASQFLPDAGLQIRPCRGHYFALSERFTNTYPSLVYPLPDPAGGLGVHLTRDLAGRCRLGPDVDWSAADRDPDEASLYAFPDEATLASLLDRFFQAGRRLLPQLRRDDLRPDYIGVRPKLFVRGQPYRDFWIHPTGPQSVWHLLGIESPGLTAALAIADDLSQLPL